MAGNHVCASSKCSGSGPLLALLPGIQSRSSVTMTATASVAKIVKPLIALVIRRGTTWSAIAAPAGMTISSVSQGM